MRVQTGVAVAVAAMCFLVPPAMALPGKDHPGKGGAGPTDKKGPTGKRGPSAKAKAYGYYCRSQSKLHEAGVKGTPFSQCVVAMAKLDKGKASSPAAACAGMSKSHTKGQPGTPFSRCVAAGAKLLRGQHK